MIQNRRRLLAGIAVLTGSPGLLAARQSQSCAALINVTHGVEGRAILPDKSWLGAKTENAVTVTGAELSDRSIEVVLHMQPPAGAPEDTPAPTEISSVRIVTTAPRTADGDISIFTSGELQAGGQKFTLPGRVYASSSIAFELSGGAGPALQARLARAVRRGGRMTLTASSAGVRMQARWTAPNMEPTMAAIDAKLLQLKQDRIAARCSVGSLEGAGCFLTTAAVHTLGLADDCWELRTLRAFRDGPLLRRPDGEAVVADYYRLAPRLVEAIDHRTDAARVWLRTYWTGVLPCAVLARMGLNGLALTFYRRMTRGLERLAT